jgi:hypothetical protein
VVSDSGVEDGDDAALGVEDGAVAEGEPRLLVESVPAHHQRQVLEERRLPGQAALGQGTDHRPDVGPDLVPPSAERTGMPTAEQSAVGVVVEHHELRTHDEHHGQARRQAEGRGGAQGG